MCGTKCPTVRSGGTISVRSALMPMVMMSRASMGFVLDDPVIPGHASSRGPGIRRLLREIPGSRFARPGMTKRLLLRSRRAFHKSLAALHLVRQRGFVDLDDDGVGIDAEILHQRLRDVAHHAGLLLVGAAGGHADGDFRHFCHSLCSCY